MILNSQLGTIEVGRKFPHFNKPYILEYGSVVWSPWTVQDKQALEREQMKTHPSPRWSVEETTQIYPMTTH